MMSGCSRFFSAIEQRNYFVKFDRAWNDSFDSPQYKYKVS